MLTGGNIDVNIVAQIIERGLVKDGRLARFSVLLRDRPGALARLTAFVAEAPPNVLQIHHDRAFSPARVGESLVELTLETSLAEGRRVIANIERVAKVFVTKTVYATVLALAVGMAGLAFPFLPRHLTLISSLTIGIPGFFLALEPNTQRSRPGFVRRTLTFALPAGLTAAFGTLVAYQVADVANVPQDQARTTATLALAGLGLVVLALAARPLNHLRRVLLTAMAGAFAVVLLVPFLRAFFALDLPPLQVAPTTMALVAALGATLSLLILRLRV